MKNKKFWKWKNSVDGDENRVLTINGVIAEDSWFDDEVTPQIFKEELNSGKGDISLWINSPGGDCIAAAQIYNMLINYKGKVTVKIDGLAASAASVVAMAGDEILMSPVATLMIHNPATVACGDYKDMQNAIDMLTEVKESIINAYAIKTGLSRSKLSHLMDSETWMNANKAIELGFADGLMGRENYICENTVENMIFSPIELRKTLINKLSSNSGSEDKKVNAESLLDRLNLIKNWR